MPLFQDAVREQSKLIMALTGPTGGGKTFTMLRVGRHLIGPTGRMAIADSENRRSLKYALSAAEAANPETWISDDGRRFRFSHLPLKDSSPENYIRIIQAAKAEGFDLIGLDSISAEWERLLEMVDEVTSKAAANRGGKEDTFGVGWRKMTPEHRKFVDAIIAADIHIICTVRSDLDWQRVEEEGSHKTKIACVGTKPKQRGDILYAFDLVLQCEDSGRNVQIIKNTCPGLDGVPRLNQPGESLACILRDWITDGVVRTPPDPLNDLSVADRAVIDRWRAEYVSLRAKHASKAELNGEDALIRDKYVAAEETPEAHETRLKAIHVDMNAIWKRMASAEDLKALSPPAKQIVVADWRAAWIGFGLKPWWDRQPQAAAG